MPQPIVILGFCLLIWWLLGQERNIRGQCSSALWIPLLWFLILGSRSPTSWFVPPQAHIPGENSANPFDTVISVGLLLAGLWTLRQRQVSWAAIIGSNKCLFLYFAYAAISVSWSDLPAASLKGWVKDAGNIVMVLIILSENDPREALKSFFFRSGIFLVVLSLMLVGYFPQLGRDYDQSRALYRFIGVSTNKNGLGATLLVCALGTFWSFIVFLDRKQSNNRVALAHVLVLAMAFWLLVICHSATSLACTVMGAGIIVALRSPRIRNLVQQLGLSFFIVMPLVGIGLNYLVDLGQIFVWTIGRDLTFTGRTGIWEWCFKVQVDPFFGSGYSSFLTGARAATVAKGLGFFYALTEVHNGYLETYFNCGLLGLVLLLAGVFSGMTRVWKTLSLPDSLFAIRITFVLIALIYNMSESAFSGPNQIWFVFLLAIVEFPRAVFKVAIDNQPVDLRPKWGKVKTAA